MGKGKKKFVFVVVAVLLILLGLCYVCYVSKKPIEETKKSHEEQLTTRNFMTKEEALRDVQYHRRDESPVEPESGK